MPKIHLADLQRNNINQNEYWSKRILEMIKLEKKNFVFTELGMTQILPKNQGTKSFSVRRYNHLPYDTSGKHNLTEGVAPEAMIVEAQKVTGVVNQKGALIEQTDVSDEVHFDNIRDIYQPELARHAAEVIERNTIEAFSDASEYFVGASNTTVNDITNSDILTFKDLRTVALSMANYNRTGHRKYGNKFVAVMHQNVMNDLLDDSVLVSKLLVPGNENGPIKQGTLAKYLAYNMYFTDTLIAPVKPNTKTPAVNVYTSYVLGRDPYMVLGLGSNNVKFFNTGFVADKADPLAQKATIGYKLWTGAKVVDPMAITRIYSGCSYDVAADFTNDDLGRAASQTPASN